jgi:hypothetical protein
MRFAEIEARLGHDATDRIQDSIASAYQGTGARAEGVCALRALLVSMLAAIVTTERHMPVAEQLAAEDGAQLNALVRKIRGMNNPGKPANADGPADRVEHKAWGTQSQRRLVAMPRGARRRTSLTVARVSLARNGYSLASRFGPSSPQAAHRPWAAKPPRSAMSAADPGSESGIGGPATIQGASRSGTAVSRVAWRLKFLHRRLRSALVSVTAVIFVFSISSSIRLDERPSWSADGLEASDLAISTSTTEQQALSEGQALAQ